MSNLLKLFLTLLVAFFTGVSYAQNSSFDGMRVGSNYVVWEAEATDSPLGKWEIITPDDARYKDNGEVPPINETHLEFTGNNPGVGAPNSPLSYKIVCPKTGKYRLTARMYQRLEGLESDKCNDVYVKMEGDFTSGNDVSLDDLKHNQKLYGRGVNQWGALTNLEIHSTGAHRPALYNLKEGEVYTLTVSGRAQRTNIDYWILFETTIDYEVGANVDLAAKNPEEYWPSHSNCQTIAAVDMNFKGIDGFVDAKTDNKAGLDILQVDSRDAWAAAQYTYEGENAFVNFTIRSMMEKDGESTYRLKVNGKIVGEATNDRIHGTTIEDYTLQAHTINQNPVALNNGDVIQVEFNNTTNGLVPEGELTATSRGRWLSLEICASSVHESYGLFLSEEHVLMQAGDSLLINVLTSLPDSLENSIVWTTDEEDIATVDSSGLLIGRIVGQTMLYVQTTKGEFSDSCTVSVVEPKPFGGEPIIIPGTVEAEHYDIGGQGITFMDLTAENEGAKLRNDAVDIETCIEGGYAVASIKKGEWLKYSIDVEEDGFYNIKSRVSSSNTTVSFSYQINNDDLTELQNITNVSGANTFFTSTSERIYLNSGEQTLSLLSKSDNWKINWIRIEKNKPVTGIALDNDSLSIIKTRSTQLFATFTPEDATNQELIWASSNSDVVSVDHSGNIRANSEGEAVITVRSVEGDFTDSCVVMVDLDRRLLRISMEETSIKITEGDSIQLSVIYVPEYASNKNVKWISSDTKVAEVDANGILIGLSKGNAVVKVESEEGKHSALCFVEVLADTASFVSDFRVSMAKVYPNPCKTHINIEQANHLPVDKIFLMTTSGQVIKEQRVQGERQIVMNVSGMKGAYRLLVKGGSRFQSIPILIKQ